MKFTLSKKFISVFPLLSESEKAEVILIYDKIRLSDFITEINTSQMVGFPHLHTIDLGKYVVGAQIKNNEIELAGIVEKGKEYTLFF